MTEKVVIRHPDLTITGAARHPLLMGRDGHPLHMVPHEVHPASWREDEVYPQGVAEKKATGKVLLEIKRGTARDVIHCLGGEGTPPRLITVVVPWRVVEETRPLLDSTQSVEEVHPEGGEAEVGTDVIFGTIKAALILIRQQMR